jgi:hypothetical protein
MYAYFWRKFDSDEIRILDDAKVRLIISFGKFSIVCQTYSSDICEKFRIFKKCEKYL